jgi:mitochondrial fission protein ELM1
MKAERGGVDTKRGRSKGPAAVLVLTDGIRGHENQSLGVASRLEDFGAVVDTFRIPRLFGYRRFKSLKVTSRRLVHKKAVQCMKWLESSGGKELLEKIKGRLQRAGIDGKDVLFLSAGSSAAPYCLALACVTGAKSCTVMTPSVLGTKPFDFAVVPEHDQPEPADNILVTLGAPNMIRPEILEREKAILERRFPPRRREQWGVLPEATTKITTSARNGPKT